MADEPSRGQEVGAKGPFPYQDPTALTDAAIKKLDEQIKERERALQALMESKLDNVKGIHEQRFEGIRTQFASNETNLQNAFTGNKNLIDAQNKANTDAAKKAEEAFKEQITGLTTFMNASFVGLSKAVDDLKLMASANSGAAINSAKMLMMAGFAVSVFAVLIALYSVAGPHIAPQVVAPAMVSVQPK
jgi:hypothetical protein